LQSPEKGKTGTWGKKKGSVACTRYEKKRGRGDLQAHSPLGMEMLRQGGRARKDRPSEKKRSFRYGGKKERPIEHSPLS